MSVTAEPRRTSLPAVHSAQPEQAGIDYELFLDCVHCGLCTSACPTYLELGLEADSPRGRIYLMRAVTDGRLELNDEVHHHLDLCLDCRACETACPSGVQYGKLIEPFRMHMAKVAPRPLNIGWLHAIGLLVLALGLGSALADPGRLYWSSGPVMAISFLFGAVALLFF